MAFAQNARTALGYVVESTFGTTPGTPSLISLPFGSHSLNMTKGALEGTDMQPDEMERHFIHSTQGVAGDITVDLRKADFDPLLESVMRSAWSTNVLKVGVTPKYFTIEEESADVTQYRQFMGMTVNSMTISASANASTPVQATFGLIGKSMTLTQATVDAGSGYTAASVNEPFNHHNGSLLLGNTGATGTAIPVTAFEFTINRNYEPAYSIGSTTAEALIAGRAIVEGKFSAYFVDNSIIDRFIAETATKLVLEIDDPSNANPYIFEFPSVKLMNATLGVGSATGPKLVEFGFRSLYRATDVTNLKITRTA